MDLIFFAHLFNGLWMVVLPIALALILARRFGYTWRLVWIGAATFIISQVLHIPFNGFALSPGMSALARALPPTLPRNIALLIQAALLGLSAGLFEELSRYFVLRFWAKDARSWRAGLLFGAGHGGVEALILGGLVLVNFVYLAGYRNADLSALFPVQQLQTAQQQVNAFWSMPWPMALLGALERTLTIPCHLAMSLLVMQAFIRKQQRWLWLAVLYHTLLDGVAVYLAGTLGQQQGMLFIEAVLALFTIASVAIIFLLEQPEPVEEEDEEEDPEDEPAADTVEPSEPPITQENLDDSKFQN